ncbi:unnamed protein product [Ectocarpus sp. CCAP 1310/34]|nr:unnamed protein product [Ectocarpus sp. CCAP 1310/34]
MDSVGDGEHLVVCRGPLEHPRRLELRRVRLQRPGLSAPGEALWSLPLSLRARGDHYAENGYASSAEGGQGGYSSGEDMEEEDGEEEMLHGPGMDGIGDEEPASVAVTESSDGFLVVAVVSRVEMQEDEDRVYHVFVAPGPSYLAAVNASAETPFVGAAFSYIVPGSGGAPVPSIAAHDVGGVDGAAGAGEERVYVIVLNAVDAIRVVEVRLHTEGAGQASPPSPSPGGGKCPARVPVGGRRLSPLPFDTTFTIRPPEPLQASSKSRGDGAGGRAGGGGGDVGGSASVGGGSSSSSADSLSLWWACGRDLPSIPLVGTHRVFPFRRRGPATSLPAATAEPALAATARGAGQLRSRREGGETAEPAAELPSGGSSISRPTEGDADGQVLTRRSGGRVSSDSGSSSSGSDRGLPAGRGGIGSGDRTEAERVAVAGVGGAEEGRHTAEPASAAAAAAAAASADRSLGRRRRAYASSDKSRQRVLDLEVFISQLLLRREAFPDSKTPHPSRSPPLPPPPPLESKPTEAKTVAAAAVTSGDVGGESAYAGGGSGGDASRAEGADSNGGVGEGDADGFSANAPSVHATDYHCVTAGLRDGGRGVLLSLVVKVMYTGPRRKRKRGGGRGDGREERGGAKTGGGSATGTRNGSGGDAGAAVEGPFLVSYILDLDLESGEVAVLGSGRSEGRRRCASMCEKMARCLRYHDAAPVIDDFHVDRPGRRLSNTAVFQGRSVGAITNPVYPVAIVMEDEDY